MNGQSEITKNNYLVHQAVDCFGKILLSPKVRKLYLKLQNFKMFQQENPCWRKSFRVKILVDVLRLGVRKSCTDIPLRLEDIGI